MAGMKIGQSFQRTSIAPVDEAFVLTKAEMLNMNDEFMPDNYFAVCKDDGKFYTYDKTAAPNAETGKFTLVSKEYTAGTGAKIENDVISFNYVTAGRKAVAYAGMWDFPSGAWSRQNYYDSTQTLDLSHMAFESTSDYDVECYVMCNDILSLRYLGSSDTSTSISHVMGTNTQTGSVPNGTITITKSVSAITVNMRVGTNTGSGGVAQAQIMYRVYYTGAQGGGGANFPPGGTDGQVLLKDSTSYYESKWGDVTAQLAKESEVLWQNSDTTNPATITLSKEMSDFDEVLVVGYVHGSNGKDHLLSRLLNTDDIQTTNAIGLSDDAGRYVWYNVTSQTSLERSLAAGDLTVYKVYGIKYSPRSAIGRWEKIGEWTSSQTGLQLDLSPYQTIALTCVGNNSTNQHNVNTVMINVEDIQASGETSLRSYVSSTENATLTKMSNGYQLTLAGTIWCARLYGYKETALSDADVQRIAAQVPGGSSITVDQTYDATSANAQSGTAVAEALATVDGSTNFDVTSIPQGPTGANEINAVVSNKDTENARLSYIRQSDGTLPNTVNLGVKSGLGEDSFELPTKGYVDSKTLIPIFITDGNWSYKINPDNTFEAYYSKSGVSLTIQDTSGNFYRSALQTLTLPTGITDTYNATPLHASVNTSHNNYPCFGTLASVATNQVKYYAMSGSSRGASPNYIVTAHVFGTLEEVTA